MDTENIHTLTNEVNESKKSIGDVSSTENFSSGVSKEESSEEHLEKIRKKLGGGNKNMKKIILIVSGVVLAGLIILGLVFLATNKSGGEMLSPLGKFNLMGEVKVENPITGVMHTEEEAAKWLDVRPMAVMVNNAVPARPQAGLVDADLIYEVVAEGGITRFVPFFNSHIPDVIGPVRSTREYFLVIVKEMGDAMIMHEGYSPQAMVAIDEWPVRSLFRGGAGCPWEGENDYCFRDDSRGVAKEHTAYAKGPALIERALELGWEGLHELTMWQFKDDTSTYSQYPSATDISIDFWERGMYSGVFKYNPETNTYLRYTGYDDNDQPIPHVDLNEPDRQVEVSNLIIQYAVESDIVGDDKGRLEYQLVGTGTGLVFIDGKVVDITWNKADRDTRTKFYDTDGNEMQFNRGKFWIAIVPARNEDQVVYN